MRRYLRILVVLACLTLPLVPATPAAANTYPGLVQKEWFHGDDVLQARIAIEVNSENQGRFRLHLSCFRTDASGRRSLQYCNFDHTALTCWYDGICTASMRSAARLPIDSRAADLISNASTSPPR
jgi:hypothetical protein